MPTNPPKSSGLAFFFFGFIALPFILLASEASGVNPIPLFDPPSGWQFALPTSLPSCIQIGFFGKGSTSFRPSINLAIEEVDVGLKEYVKAVKEIHLSEPGTTWRDLGKFKTRSGEGRLAEIGMTNAFGPIKMLQMIVVKEKTAYILTAATHRNDFLRVQETILQAFQTLRLEPDLFSPLPEGKRKRFDEFFSQIGQALESGERDAKWADLQRLALQEAPEMGEYWQFLVLKAGREKLYR